MNGDPISTGAVLERFTGEGWDMAVRTRPLGRELLCEVLDITFAQGAGIPYHVRTHGHMTAVLLSGQARVTLYGRTRLLEPGDLVQIEPHMPGGFHFLKAGSVLRTILHGAGAAELCRRRQRILSQNPAGPEREALLAELYGREGIRRLPEPAAEPANTLPEISPRGTGQDAFSLSGVICRLRAGRWQLGGEAEIWEYDMAPGKVLSSPGRPVHPTLLMVLEGQAEMVRGSRSQTGGPGDLLWASPYETFTVTAGPEGAALLDCRCAATLLRYLEEWEAARNAADGGAGTQAALARQNDGPLTGLA